MKKDLLTIFKTSVLLLVSVCSVAYADHDSSSKKTGQWDPAAPTTTPEMLRANEISKKWEKLGDNIDAGTFTPGSIIYRKQSDGRYDTLGYIDSDGSPVLGKLSDSDNNGFTDQLERFTTMGADKDGKIVQYGKWTDNGFALNKERIKQLAKDGKLDKTQVTKKTGKDGEEVYIMANNPNGDMSITSQELLGAFLTVGKDGKLLGQTADFLVKREAKEKDDAEQKKEESEKLDATTEKKALEKGWQ